MRWSTVLASLASILAIASAQQDTTCSAVKPCLQGCCSKYGQCGFGADFCGDGCQGTCDAKPECGDGALKSTCPLGVCCSKYGFCGTTADFCGAGCQNGCDAVNRPSCSVNTDALALKRRIGYYGMFNLDKQCNRYLPEHIPGGAFTHINLAFAEIGSDFKVIDDPHQGDIINRATHLKDQYPGLRVNIALGGWDFNDPPTQHLFSDMVSSYDNQMAFVNSITSFLTKYGLDGVDIDWEYPVANDRGGRDADYDNFVVMLARLREEFNRNSPGYEISITLPSSYWYLRGFSLQNLQRQVDYFNVMTYDLHGMWDQHNRFTGPYLKGHTNITEIEQGLDLLWRNGVDPKNVVMGFGFYGRSFTMTDPSCSDPNKGCTFSAAGLPGDCSDTAGILTYSEIMSRNDTFNAKTYYDPVSTVKYTTYQYDQWISYDDEQSFTDKKKYLSSRCVSGLMIWAVDQDSQNYDALNGLLGAEAVQESVFQGSQLSDDQKRKRSSQFAAYTGQNCFVTERCTDGTDGQKGDSQVCPAGTVSVETAHSPLQAGGHLLSGDCAKGWYRQICCPSNEVPKNCEWTGAPVRSTVGCSGKCGPNQFELNTDPFTDAKGNGQCFQGKRSLCCDSTALLNDCFWTGCQGPLLETQNPGELGTPGCPADTNLVATRYDTDDGGWCSRDVASSDLHSRFKRALCCPKKESFKHCHWDNDNNWSDAIPDGQAASYHPCTPGQCWDTQVKISQGRQPAPIPSTLLKHADPGYETVADTCAYDPIRPGFNDEFSLCCDPPSEYTDRWPVPPHYLWANSYEGDDDDVAWTFSDNYGNNNADSTDQDQYQEPGTDPYGFIMLDGPPESISSNFGSDFSVAKRSIEPVVTKRSLLTTNQTILDATFEHAEETIYVYCNHPAGSPQCEQVFLEGAPDTIISLPAHVGEGPYARIVSMDLAEHDYELPAHHVRARAEKRNENPVYKLKFDYNFHAIRQDSGKGPVNMRVDYTNLQTYWGEVTNSQAKKRHSEEDPLTNEEWKGRVKRAAAQHTSRKRNLQVRHGSTEMQAVEKRWFGDFVNWLKKLNTVESANKGYLEMILQKSFLLYEASKGCLGRGYYARIQMFLDTKVEMDATYAYYFTGTIVPPKVDKTFAYLAVEPSAYLGLRIQGQAQLIYTSERKKLVDTLTYPGLSIKGIATIGPALDIYGQIKGQLTLSGQIKAGAEATFGKAELFFPQGSDADAEDVLNGLPSSNSKPPDNFQLTPQFLATAKAEAKLQIIVTPEARLGLAVAPKILGKQLVTLVDAQLIGFVNGTLQFNATAIAQAGTDVNPSFTYAYGAYLIFNLGYGGYANILSGTWNWNYGAVYAYPYPGKQYPIFESGNLASDNSGKTINSKRLELDGFHEHDEHNDVEDIQYSRIMGRAILNDEAKAILRAAAPLHKIRSLVAEAEAKQHSNTSVNLNSLMMMRRADDDTPVDMQDVTMTSDSQSFTCPPRGTRDVTLPDYRYNCLVFATTRLEGPADANGNRRTTTVPGICDGITEFFNIRALSANGLTLTYEPTQRNARDSLVCGSSFCKQTNADLRNSVGLRPKQGRGADLTSCDEFPFGSAEEGGDFFPRFAARRSRATSTCVPVWQQQLQSNCNGLLGRLNTNIYYFDQQTDASATLFRSWALQAWISSRREPADGDTGGNTAPPFERLARYPEIIPRAPGINIDDYNRRGMMLGKNFRRNYTFGLAYTNAVSDNDWGAQPLAGFSYLDSSINNGARGTDGTLVACAVNTFGQPDVFKWDMGSWNGFCYRGPGDAQAGWGNPPSFARCRIDFQGSTFDNNVLTQSQSKRDFDHDEQVIGNFTDMPITRVELDPDTSHDIVVDEENYVLPDGAQWMPAFVGDEKDWA